MASIQQAREDEERKDREEAGKKWKEIEKAEKKRNDEINYEKMVFTFISFFFYQVCRCHFIVSHSFTDFFVCHNELQAVTLPKGECHLILLQMMKEKFFYNFQWR